MQDGLPHLLMRRLDGVKSVIEILIYHLWRAASCQSVRYVQHDVSATFTGVEDARAIRKAALCIRQLNDLPGQAIETANRLERLRDLLPISSDVLDRCSPYETWDPAHALE